MQDTRTRMLVRADELARMLGVGRTTIWRWRQDGTIPPPRRLSAAVVGWPIEEIEEWLAARPAADPVEADG